ncbi:MAG: protein kinase [Acidobacteria bacterium]|nr:protein kinase [Acidobacteriota bacterium]
MTTKYCPKCNQEFPVALRSCSADNHVLSLRDPYHLVGRTILDKYRILALVGVGGMGAVYCAYHLGIDRRVAFKILQPNLAVTNKYVVELFEREARLAGRLSHRNIVDVKDAGQTPDGIAYIAMEWLEGRSLEEALSNLGRISFKRAIGIVRQIAAALEEAHSKHIIHRDLKPANVMLLDSPDGSDQVRVLDFGIGKVIEETTASSPVSAVMGTPQYASPEQLIVGGQIDGRSDIYSLGVILYRMIVGQVPFDSPSIGELIQLQLTSSPTPVSVLRPETPAAMVDLINKILAKEADHRPQSAQELLTLLDNLSARLDSGRVDTADVISTSRNVGTETIDLSLIDDRATRTINKTPVALGVEQIEAAVPTTNLITPEPTRQARSLRTYAIAVIVTVIIGSYGLYSYLFSASSKNGQNQLQQAQVLDAGSASIAQAGNENIQPSPVPNATDKPQARPDTRDDQIAAQVGEQASKSASDQVQSQASQRQASEHLTRARALYQQGQYQHALRECNESLRLNPNQSEARQLKRKISELIQILNSR